MPLAENHDVVEALAADAADHPLHVRCCHGLLGAMITSSMPIDWTRLRKSAP
jgi:hypothetical protein